MRFNLNGINIIALYSDTISRVFSLLVSAPEAVCNKSCSLTHGVPASESKMRDAVHGQRGQSRIRMSMEVLSHHAARSCRERATS
jgi:hypothetical protein